MDGNLVATVYYNFGEIADWQNEPTRSGVWPKGTNHTYIDGVAVIVQAEAMIPAGVSIHPLETNYYEYTRNDLATGSRTAGGRSPIMRARFQSSPAQSNDPETWPSHWPDRPSDWDGYGTAIFGKGVQNADLETYFVFDDNEDREYILKNHFHPDAADTTRGGLGMQVHARGFQWSQVLAEDVIFWYYEITNMGTTDYATDPLRAVRGLGDRGARQLVEQCGELQQAPEYLLRVVDGGLRQSRQLEPGRVLPATRSWKARGYRTTTSTTIRTV